MTLKPAVEQRIREAAKAAQAGREVIFAREEGGAGFVLAAHYQGMRHTIFTCGTAGSMFFEMEREVRTRFAAALSEVTK